MIGVSDIFTHYIFYMCEHHKIISLCAQKKKLPIKFLDRQFLNLLK